MRTQNLSHRRNSSTCLHNGRPTGIGELCLFGGRGTGADCDFSSKVYVEITIHFVPVFINGVLVCVRGATQHTRTPRMHAHVYLRIAWPALFVLKLEREFWPKLLF